MKRLLFVFLAACGGSSGVALDGLAPPASSSAADAAPPVLADTSSSSEDAPQSAPDSGAGDDAADAATSDALAPDAGSDSAPAPDAAPDACANVVAQPGQCGVVQGCDLGACATSGDLCGGSSTTLNFPANQCGHVCLDNGQESACSDSNVPFQTTWAAAGGCAYVYRLEQGKAVLRGGGISGCVNVQHMGDALLCCP